MFDSFSDTPFPYVSMEQALTNIIDSISKEEAAVAVILNAEGEILQKTKSFVDDVEDYVALNISINDIMKNAVRLQILLQLKLEEAQRSIQNVDDIDRLEE